MKNLKIYNKTIVQLINLILYSLFIFLPAITIAADDVDKLYEICASDISPRGELAKMFNIGSQYTDLQREEMLEKLAGKMIHWELPLYEISKIDQFNYKIITSGRGVVDCVIYLTTMTSTQNADLRELKTGDMIKIKGMLTGKTFMRSLIIKPAILAWSDDPC